MPDSNGWPRLTWTTSSAVALQQRVDEIAIRARRFETALEEAAEAGEADLSAIAEELSVWDLCSAGVFMYTGLGEGRRVADGDVTEIAAELEKVYADMLELRDDLLRKLGAAVSNRVLGREAHAVVDEASIREPPAFADPVEGEAGEGELPSWDGGGGERESPDFDEAEDPAFQGLPSTFDAASELLTGDSPPEPELVAAPARPVTADELRSRQAAEQKPLPKSGNLGALLGILPSEWVNAIYVTLDLPEPGDDEMTVGSRSAIRRGIVFEHLHRESFLQQTVDAFGEEERALLSELLDAGGLPYPKVAATWGLDEDDGFYWTERTPSGPLACLRRAGLAYVGLRDGKSFVVTPADLAEKLRKALATV